MAWMIEGHWSGPVDPAGDYASFQHREFTENETFARLVKELGYITFTDNTTLALTVRKENNIKRLPEKNGYGSLIRKCIQANTSKVNDLPTESWFADNAIDLEKEEYPKSKSIEIACIDHPVAKAAEIIRKQIKEI